MPRSPFQFLRTAFRSRPAAPVPPRATALPAPSAIGDFTPIFWANRRLTPDEIRWILTGAVGGNLQLQWSLFDLMEDTWPRLAKNLTEVRRAAARAALAVQPYSERGQQPTARALERAALVEAALKNWRPRPGTLELGFEDALFHSLDALGKGLSVLEITWQRHAEGLMPRCAHFLHPRRYGWNPAGTELGLVGPVQSQVLAQPSSAFQPFSPSALSSSTWQPFPPGQFWIGTWHGRSGAPGQTALLRCLAPYWCGITFGWEWLLNNAQIFGVPLRWATYDPNQPQLLGTLSQMLTNLGSAGWAAFPAGTTLDFKEAVQRASDNPQVFVQELANSYCDQLILGQDASGQRAGNGLGQGSGGLHGDVRDARLQDAAQWCADLLNYQLVPSLLRWNWGDESEPPTITIDDAGETDPQAKAARDQILASIAPLPRKWFYERHAIPAPTTDEPTVGGATSLSPAAPSSPS